MTTIQKARKAYKEALANVSKEDLEKIIKKIDEQGSNQISYLNYLKYDRL